MKLLGGLAKPNSPLVTFLTLVMAMTDNGLVRPLLETANWKSDTLDDNSLRC